MSKISPLLLVIAIFIQCQHDFGKLAYVATFPSLLDECSGIAKDANTGELYAHNDSKGANAVYVIDPRKGSIKRSIIIENAYNDDWEDITIAGNTLYVGDFGNNSRQKEPQVIYWVSRIDTLNQLENTVHASKITFTYEETGSSKKPSYDVESLIAIDSHFYLFTRNRAHPFTGITKVFKIPIREGNQKATYVTEYKIGEDRSDCQVTAADYHKETGTIALLTYNKVFLLSDYEDDLFFSGTIKKIHLKHSSQKEAIAFENYHTLYIGEEGPSKGVGGNLYTLELN